MTPDELLKPRYKVIADYPGNLWQIGEILDRDWGWNGDDENGFKNKVSDYPHLFKPLQWWEDRKKDDMPDYVKQEGMVDSRNRPIPDRVIKVNTHWANTATHPYGNVKVFSSSDNPQYELYSQMYFDWQPATESEYHTYINSKR